MLDNNNSLIKEKTLEFKALDSSTKDKKSLSTVTPHTAHFHKNKTTNKHKSFYFYFNFKSKSQSKKNRKNARPEAGGKNIRGEGGRGFSQ